MNIHVFLESIGIVTVFAVAVTALFCFLLWIFGNAMSDRS